MYGYKDYFKESLAGKPYRDAAEARDDYRALAEMLLEDLAGIKGLGTEDGLFSKGLVVTEQEMREYFVNHPDLRDVDSYYYALGDAVQDALSYIHGREAKTPAKVKLPMKQLAELYALSDQELILVTLAYLTHTHRSFERVFGFLQDDMASTEPTLGLALTLLRRSFEDAPEAEEIISKKRGLFGSLFQEIGDDRMLPLRSVLYLTRAAAAFLNETELEEDSVLISPTEEVGTPVFYTDSCKSLAGLLALGEELPGLYMAVDDPEAAAYVARAACEKAKRRFYRASATAILLCEEDKQQELSETLSFLAKTGQTSLLLTGVDDAALEQEKLRTLLTELGNNKPLLPVLYTGQKKTPQLLKQGTVTGQPVLTFELPAPDAEERTAMWKHFIKSEGLSLEKGFVLEEVSDCYEVGYFAIKTSVKQARINMLARGKKKLTKEIVTDALKGIGTVNFHGLAKEVRTVYTWDDITMNQAERRILQTACDRYKMKNRIGEGWEITKKNAYGNGVSVLLYGPPGTGKTMSAQVVASEIGLPLYRVDTSQLFSKYIGETQKNLNAVFDEAEKSNVILFFDEADALFSKRTDVENSNDRHANQEIAFLLQRIEEYKGMSLLATNYYSGFDQAFVRRITYAVRLEQPDEAARLTLWKNTLPEAVPKEKNIDYEFLAKTFEITGSNIKAILLSAAYMAGAEGAKLGMPQIVRAMKYEFDKLGMMPDSGKFGPYAAFMYA